MAAQSEQKPDIPANEFDHIDLWKYFESRGAGVKDTMFNVVTWILGFAAVILGFIFKETITFEKNSVFVNEPFLLFLLATIGVFVTIFAQILISDFSYHINLNFDRADRAREKTKSLLEILDIDEVDPNRSTEMPNICKHVLIIVWIFGGIFLLCAIAAVLFLLLP